MSSSSRRSSTRSCLLSSLTCGQSQFEMSEPVSFLLRLQWTPAHSIAVGVCLHGSRNILGRSMDWNQNSYNFAKIRKRCHQLQLVKLTWSWTCNWKTVVLLFSNYFLWVATLSSTVMWMEPTSSPLQDGISSKLCGRLISKLVSSISSGESPGRNRCHQTVEMDSTSTSGLLVWVNST